MNGAVLGANCWLARLSDSRDAWLGGLTWGNKWLNLVGEYGEVDAGYAFNPFALGI